MSADAPQPSLDAACPSSRLRPSEWGPAKNDREDPRNPETIAREIYRMVTAGDADDN